MVGKIFPKISGIVLGLTLIPLSVMAIVRSDSVGSAGIDARRLQQAPYNLIGRKIAIGQVEVGRPGQFGIDKAVSQHRVMDLSQVFWRDQKAKSDTNLDPHAAQVASIIISRDKAFPGIAPGARLYASAVGSIRKNGQPEECLAAQYVAEQNSNDVRAINFSFGESLDQDPRPNANLDGNALLTQCIDWLARTHNVLYVVAGNQGKGGIPIPTDNYNGINVAFSTRRDGIFTKVDFANLGSNFSGFLSRLEGKEGNIDGRRGISLVAPGSNLALLGLDGKVSYGSGTSFAAPHVTATVALLQEFGDRQLRTHQPNWSINSRRHEVMKAVLMNSADKIKDDGDGLYLGMTRTLIDQHNLNWLESDAYTNKNIPLDNQMGTGHLNAFRAYQQFSAGQWYPQQPIPPIGWDYNTVEVKGNTFQDYLIGKPLKQGSFVSITLAWDRLIELNDYQKKGDFQIGATFRDRGLNNLQLQLISMEDQQEVWSSNSQVDSIQHIFHQIPKTGQYKIRVKYQKQANEPIQPYAIAWWTVPDS